VLLKLLLNKWYRALIHLSRGAGVDPGILDLASEKIPDNAIKNT